MLRDDGKKEEGKRKERKESRTIKASTESAIPPAISGRAWDCITVILLMVMQSVHSLEKTEKHVYIRVDQGQLSLVGPYT